MSHRVIELHSIMPIANIASVLRYGIMSHDQARLLPHSDVSMQEIQDRRAHVTVPNGLSLHQYANLYFCARNPMMYKRQSEHERLCVLQISLAVLRITGVVISDCNAASSYVRFYDAEAGMAALPFERIFDPNWVHPDDPGATLRHKSQKCAEVLVPHVVGVELIKGAYVSTANASDALSAQGFRLPIGLNPAIFFRNS